MRISELKKVLYSRGFKISKLKKNTLASNFKNIYLIFFASLLLIGIFWTLPFTSNFVAKNIKKPKTYENYSKQYLEKVLSGEKLITNSSIDDELDQRYLYEDVEYNDGPSKSVRIEASVLNEMFNNKNYKLSLVRKDKLVKPFEVGMLPEEMKFIENTKERKDLFIKIVLPLILSENNKLKRDRQRLFKILNKSNNTKAEKNG